ncbi:uncharacterized protein PRCAT00001604001 [Priceomyces carsonii]|uniref:uncharacterized protein n=1 Tax=Priceomyces carsonii TaxID=28549 RepID=UPI002EDAF584|nr:unnamed protein product [Priceomyces carsonii]
MLRLLYNGCLKSANGIFRPSIRTFFPPDTTKRLTAYDPLPPKRNGENVLSYLHKHLLQRYDPTGKRRALVDQENGLRAGDIIKVTYLDRTNVVGQVIAIKRSVNNVGTNILIRNKFNKMGCELRIPLFNPNIRNIETLHKPKKYLSRRKQFYIRKSKYDVGDVEAFLKSVSKKTSS